MIDISKLTEADKQREVRYSTPTFDYYGTLHSWNEHVVFVRYQRRVNRRPEDFIEATAQAQATRPEDLEFV